MNLTRGFTVIEVMIVMAIVWILVAMGVYLTRAMLRDNRKIEDLSCHDESWLLATTAGSPSGARCPNVHHHMRVQIATAASPEEGVAVVFCECQAQNGKSR